MQSTSPLNPQSRAAVGYGLAVLFVSIALGVALPLRVFRLESFLLLMAIALTVRCCGLGPGILALVLSTLGLHYFFVAPLYSFAFAPGDIPYLAVFLIFASLMTWLSASFRRAEQSLLHAREDLEVQVRDRTAELRASEEQWRDVFENHPTMYFLVDASGTTRSVNPFGAEQLGYTIDELVGQPVLNVFVEADREAAQRNFARCIEQSGRPMTWEARKVRKDGTVLWVRETAKAVRRAKDQTIVLIACQDITEAKWAEEEIRKQAALLGLAHDAILVRDLNSRVTFWNRGAEQTYGWTAEEAIGRVTHELLQTRFPVSLAAVEAALLEEGGWEGELAHVTRDGTAIIVASRHALQRDERGAPGAILEINRDITDRKRVEEALRNSQAELAHVMRMTTLGELTASFAHEVNQPLAAIVNNANACLGLLPASTGHGLDEAREALGDIVDDADRASAIIARLRGLAKKSPLEKLPLHLDDVVEDVLTLAAGELAARYVTSRTEVPADLAVVSGDRVQLQQVLLNLVVNAIESMSAVEGRERLLVIRGREDTDDGTPAIAISVQDCGVGLKAEEVGRLFEAFYTTKPQGMGMGLAISRSIIEAHGGRLWAEPNQGPGATFSFSLPAAEQAHGADGD